MSSFNNIPPEAIPCISFIGNIAVKANDAFLKLTGYTLNDILGNTLSDIWSGLLRININIHSITKDTKALLFDKSRDVKAVTVNTLFSQNSEERAYIFEEYRDNILNESFPIIKSLYKHTDTAAAIFGAKDYILLDANDNYFSIYPYKNLQRKEIIGTRIDSFVDNWDSASLNEIWNNVVRTGMPHVTSEHYCSFSNFDSIYWDCNLSPIQIDGKVEYLILVIKDVTSSVKARIALNEKNTIIEQQNKALEAIFENMSDILLVFDNDGNYIKLNKSAELLMPSLILNKAEDWHTDAKYYDAHDRELDPSQLPVSRLKRGEKVVNNRLVIRTAEKELHFDINGTPIFDENGSFLMGVLCCGDITEYINQTKTIKNQKEELEAIIENIGDAIFIYDKHGNRYMQNKAARKYFSELNQEGLAAVKLYDVLGAEVPSENMPICRVLRGETIKNERLMAMRGDYSRYMDICGSPILDEEGKNRLSILYSRDITTNIENEYKIKLQQDLLLKAEIEKREALEKALALKDDFLSFISHEFKVPLTVISSALQTMEFICRDQMPEKAKKFLNTIRQNTNRQLRLVNNLLDITRINAGQLKVIKSNIDIVFLTGSIVNSVQLYAQQKDIKLGFFSELPCQMIDIDEEKYERILLNLLSNAIKYTASGKEVNVRLSMDNLSGRNTVCVEVQDEGIGIPPDQHDHIFERFGQVDSNLARQAEGTGIGLSLVKLLVATLGGKIELESEVGKGSTFKILLPAVLSGSCNEAAVSVEYDSRLVQATAIEFSDIYF